MRQITLCVVLILMAPGCRDAMTAAGDRIGESHVLASRPMSRGGPTATPNERQRGWFDTVDADLSTLESALDNLGFEIDVQVDTDEILPGTIRAWFNGFFMPTPPDFVGPPVWIPSGPGTNVSMSTTTLLSELETACDDPLYQRFLGSACDVDIDFAVPDLFPIDGFIISPRPGTLDLRWAAPRRTYNRTSTSKTAGDARGGNTCDDDDDCDHELTCVDGVCSCDEGQCGSGFSCEAGTCVWDVVPCTSHAMCSNQPDWGDDDGNCDATTDTCERRVFWSSNSDASMEHPVLAAYLAWDVTIDPDDAVELFTLEWDIDELVTELRFQFRPCDGDDRDNPACGDDRAYFAGYRGTSPDGDLSGYPSGLVTTVRNRLIDYDVSVEYWGATCWLSPGAPIACIVMEVLGRQKLQWALTMITRALGNVMSATVVQPALPVRPRGTEDAVAAAFTLERNRRISLGETPPDGDWADHVLRHAPLDLRWTPITSASVSTTLLTPDGALRGETVRAVSEGLVITGLGLDASVLREFCGDTPHLGIGGRCGADPGISIVCADVCDPCAASGSSLCDFSSGALVLPLPASNPVLAPFAVHPPLPALARVLDLMFHLGDTQKSVLTGPLAATAPEHRRYTDIAWCDGTSTSARCPSSSTADPRVVFHYEHDFDLDGVPDAYAAADCPRNAPPAYDWDLDGYHDDCDPCPEHEGGIGDVDGDGIGDNCDCDWDNDECVEPYVFNPAPTRTGHPDPIIGCGPPEGDRVWDQQRRHDDREEDTDGDGMTNDCDGDDDNDGIPDDGRDGDAPHGGTEDDFDIYEPCRRGQTEGCDDNCIERVNPGQADDDDNGIGNACDVICRGEDDDPWICRFADELGFRADRDWGEGLAVDIDSICPECVLSVLCADPAVHTLPRSFAEPGTPLCGPGGAVVRGFADIPLDLAGLAADLGISSPSIAGASLVPDFDFDGYQEIMLVVSGDQAPGGVGVFGSASMGTMWRSSGEAFGAGGFTSAVHAGAFVIAGAPTAQGGGRAAMLDAETGDLLGLLGPFGADESFGASVAASDTHVLLGAPLADGGKGRIYVIAIGDDDPEWILYGTKLGSFVGSGPMVPFTRGGESFVAAGSPSAQSGRGAVIIYQLGVATPVAMFVGDSIGDELGASLSVLDPVAKDGSWQAFIGAPGADGGYGEVLGLRGDWTLVEGLIRGRFAARLGASMVQGPRGLVIGSATVGTGLGDFYGGWGTSDALASPETCDGLDDDGDGLIDEDADEIGAACDTRMAEHCAYGVQQCVAGGVVCVPPVGSFELCDGIDNDCDGVTDDDCGCDHELCSPGPALVASCDARVGEICKVDPYCCTTYWDGLCVNEVLTVADAFICPLHWSGCAHSPCETGPKLTASCDGQVSGCVADICAADPYCCNNQWDSICVGEVASVCGATCE